MRTLKNLLRGFRGEVASAAPPEVPPVSSPSTAASSTLTLEQASREALSLYQKGDLAEAERLCRLILSARQDYFDALHLLGVIALNSDRGQEGAEFLARAVQVNPSQAQAQNNLGAALGTLGRYEEALLSYGSAIDLDPGFAEAHKNRGVAFRGLRRHREAAESFERAVSLRPDYAEGHFALGTAHQALGQLEAALVSYDRALALAPGYVAALYNRGALLADMKRYSEALEAFQSGLRVRPDFDFLYGIWLQTKMRICDWREVADFSALEERVSRGEQVATPGILAMSASPAIQLKSARIWSEAKFPADPSLGGFPPRSPGEKIRIGYFSSDFHNHPIAHLTAGIFESHDRSRFVLSAFSSGPRTGDEAQMRIQHAFEDFVDVRNLPDREVAALARHRGIDIAIDLGGHTADSRTGVFALRAAPVQASYLGFLGTMGSPYMDYLLADPTIIPPESREFYSEKIAYLPVYQANEGRRNSGRIFSRQELGLPESGFVFCCFNNSYKITPRMFSLWMRILDRAAGSVLLLYAENDDVKRNLREEARLRQIDPGRLVFGERLSLPDYLARYRAAGLFLDTAPYNAGTTASDALWTGLPVLTLEGKTFAGRVGASLLCALGIPELVTHSESEYEALAVRLAHEPEVLARIATKVESHRSASTLYDISLFTRNLETAFTKMHATRMNGLPPEHLHVGR